MDITFLKRGKNVDEDMKSDIDFVSLLKRGAIHYVSLAIPGLNVVSSNIMHGGGFDTTQRNDFMMRVNQTKETGTLYPKVNITLLPSPVASYGGMDSDTYNNGDYPAEDVITHILDAFKANSRYIKSKKVYFDFRNLCVSEAHYISCLKTAIDSLDKEKLPEVITWSPR